MLVQKMTDTSPKYIKIQSIRGNEEQKEWNVGMVARFIGNQHIPT